LKPAWPLTAWLLLTAGFPVVAETHSVGVNESGFSPATLAIKAGDTVVWVNYDEFFPHTTTSDLSLFDANYWNGLLVEAFDTFAHTFNSVGTFTYHDQIDTGTGTIIVSGPATSGVQLEAPRKEDSQFVFEATGLTVGKTNVLEASINLTSWVALGTNVAAQSSMSFTNATALPHRFFRLKEL